MDQWEGYLAIALDDRRYLDLAVNLGLSIRRCETRPISVIVSPGMALSSDERGLFDEAIEAPPDGVLLGAMNKARRRLWRWSICSWPRSNRHGPRGVRRPFARFSRSGA